MFEREGIKLVYGKASRVERAGGGHALVASTAEGEVQVNGDTLLVATGRRPVVGGMALEKVGVALTKAGAIQVHAAPDLVQLTSTSA